MRLKLRNAIAEAIVAALAARAKRVELDALEAALVPGGAVLDPELARHLVRTGVFAEGSDGRVGVRPELSETRATARARVARGRRAVESYWAEKGTRSDASHDPDSGSAATRGAGSPTARQRDDRLAIALVQAAHLFNAGLYFEVHEVLEAAWQGLKGEVRLFVQGLIQIAVALHHLQDGNHAGARSLFRAGRAKVGPYAPEYRGVKIDDLLRAIEPWERSAEAETRAHGLTAPVLQVR